MANWLSFLVTQLILYVIISIQTRWRDRCRLNRGQFIDDRQRSKGKGICRHIGCDIEWKDIMQLKSPWLARTRFQTCPKSHWYIHFPDRKVTRFTRRLNSTLTEVMSGSSCSIKSMVEHQFHTWLDIIVHRRFCLARWGWSCWCMVQSRWFYRQKLWGELWANWFPRLVFSCLRPKVINRQRLLLLSDTTFSSLNSTAKIVFGRQHLAVPRWRVFISWKRSKIGTVWASDSQSYHINWDLYGTSVMMINTGILCYEIIRMEYGVSLVSTGKIGPWFGSIPLCES